MKDISDKKPVDCWACGSMMPPESMGCIWCWPCMKKIFFTLLQEIDDVVKDVDNLEKDEIKTRLNEIFKKIDKIRLNWKNES